MAPEGLQKGRFQSPHCSHASRGKKSHRSPGHDGEIRHTAGDDGFGCAPYTDSGQGPGGTLGSRAREVSEGAGTGRGSQTPREERWETRGKTRLGDRSFDSGTRLGIWDPDRRLPPTHTPRARERTRWQAGHRGACTRLGNSGTRCENRPPPAAEVPGPRPHSALASEAPTPAGTEQVQAPCESESDGEQEPGQLP